MNTATATDTALDNINAVNAWPVPVGETAILRAMYVDGAVEYDLTLDRDPKGGVDGEDTFTIGGKQCRMVWMGYARVVTRAKARCSQVMRITEAEYLAG